MLREWLPVGHYTGRECRRVVVGIWSLDDIGCPGFVAMQIAPYPDCDSWPTFCTECGRRWV